MKKKLTYSFTITHEFEITTEDEKLQEELLDVIDKYQKQYELTIEQGQLQKRQADTFEWEGMNVVNELETDLTLEDVE